MARTVIRPNWRGIAGLLHHIQKIHDDIVEDVMWDAWMHAAMDTGEMRASIHKRFVRPLLSHVVVGTDHWHLVEYPTSAHEIRPQPPKQALYWPGAPHPVQVVHHPGTEEQPFMRPALYKIRSLRKWS